MTRLPHFLHSDTDGSPGTAMALSGKNGGSGQTWGLLVGLLLIVGILWSPQWAWATPSIDTTSAPQKYWIFLEERPRQSSTLREARWTQPVAPSYLEHLRAVGVEPQVRSRWFHAVSARLPAKQRAAVANLPFVRTTHPVARLHSANISSPTHSASAFALASDPTVSVEYGASQDPLSRINALAPIERGLNGHGVRVGFLDAHFSSLRHPAFSRLRPSDRLGGLRNFTAGRQGGNHGAGVASVAIGYDPGALVGPAHGATVFGATTEYTQFERNVEEDNFVAGLEWLHRQGVDVVNVSIGYTTFDEGERSYSPDDLDGDTAITTRAVDRAAQLGVTVVVSAGNSGCANPDACWFYVNTPADADSAIAVGAIAPDSSLAPFSARGPTADGRRKPDVLVQGREVAAAWEADRYARVEGTSFASPQVTGVIAQMLQVNPSLRPMQVRRLLRQTASQAHAPDTSRGWGIVNADAAVRAAEWQARRSPPSSLEVSVPYQPVASSGLVVPVTAPARTSTLRASLATPSGHHVRHVKRVGHPGPNRLAVDTEGLSPGLYRFEVQTDTGHRATGRVTITE
jgi:serine protease AprX